MAAESPNSSWHPALMPDHDEASAPAAESSEAQPTVAPEAHTQPEDAPADPTKASDDATTSVANGGADAWLTQDDDDANDAWLVSDDPAEDPQSQEPEPAAAMEEAPIEPSAETSEQPAPGEESPTKTSLHSSSMSFARTVSHEVNLDDDDGDWNLQRTDTDPFKFMPPNERTNSFPVVPPMAPESGAHDEQPLPANQALDVMEEADKDADEEEKEYKGEESPVAASELEEPRRTHARSISIGGDVHAEQDASEARYEEGVPLIHETQNESDVPVKQDAFSASFDEEGGNDDFFTQLHENGTSEEAPAPVQPLERKSTMQVMESTSPAPVAAEPTLDVTVEETEPTELEKLEEPTATAAADDTPAEPSKPADLASKWEEAFADNDDDFLLEDTSAENKEVDPAAFLGSDDEGFLEDEEDEPAPAAQPIPPAPVSRQTSNPYMPQSAPVPQTSAYAPPAVASSQPAHNAMYPATTPAAPPFSAAPQWGAPPPARPPMEKAQSFADKAKGGYSSPYDLPTDLMPANLKPRKRASMQQLPRNTPPPQQNPGLPRSASMFMPGPPSTTLSPPSSSHGQPPQGPPKAATPSTQPKQQFFEDLPMTSKPRPSSRASIRAPSPAQQHPPPPPHAAQVPPHTITNMAPPPLPVPAPAAPPQSPPRSQAPSYGNLVAPEKVSPYASVQNATSHLPPPSTTTSTRYSPAPPQPGAPLSAPPAASTSRYSPAPPVQKSHHSYGPVAAATVPPPVLPFQPRTSSPLTHVETTDGAHGGATLAQRRASSSFEPKLTRVPSLPPTREVDEEDEQGTLPRSLSATYVPSTHESRYSPVSPPKASRQTPPPVPTYAGQTTLSPPKSLGSSYIPQAPQAHVPTSGGFVPPPRAQTQSPSAVFGHRQGAQSSDSTKRPSSAHSHSATSPTMTRASPSAYVPAPAPAPVPRLRGQSVTMNMVAPTDGREQDPLQRWKGVPVFTWGVGGSFVTSFPNSAPRYGMNQTVPSIIRTPGEVKVRNIKDLEPLPERYAKFPGPLMKGRKKKETIAWLGAGIEDMEKDLPEVTFHSQLSTEAKRSIERLLLWKILRVFIEFDGTLEGSPAAEKAVRAVLSPGTASPTADDDALFPGAAGLASPAAITSMQSDGADASVMDQVRHHLLRGDREKAVWALVDKRLWGHAMLISHTVEGELYKRVAQEFVRKEVNYPGHTNESMAAFYKILSGNFDDCVDELVPVHARAGLQLVSTIAAGPTEANLDGLDKWRETVCFVLSNRSVDDTRGLNALGNLLASYGRPEAAHICFLFGRNASVFGGLDDPSASFALIGADHRQQPDRLGKETEAIQLSEVYEFGLSLAGGVAAAVGAPHLTAYKLQHAMTLAEYGHRDKALQYAEAIAASLTSQTKRSPYHSYVLEAAVDDLLTRVKQAPKEEGNSWMSKRGKVSDTVWTRFSQFVSGENGESNGGGTGAEGEAGPFGRIATTPTISRSPSVTNFDPYASQAPGYPMGMPQGPTTAATARYAPATPGASAVPVAGAANPYEAQYISSPAASVGRNSNELRRPSYEPSYLGTSPSSGALNNYAPAPVVETAPALAPAAQITEAASPGGYQPFGMQASPGTANAPAVPGEKSTEWTYPGYQPSSYGYEPPQSSFNPAAEPQQEDAGASVTGGYEPPSFQPYGYEPPSYDPNPEQSAENDEGEPKPKKKSFMDLDDEDDIPALKPQSQEKSKSEKDKENEELVRKAAEEDAKRDAAQQAAKKGWGFGSWFKKAEAPAPDMSAANKPVRAKLGDKSSFVYDPDLKRWVNKAPGAENTPAKAATPPPPRAGPRSVSGTPPPPHATPPPPGSSSSAPPPLMPPRMRSQTPDLARAPSMDSLAPGTPPMARSVSNTSNPNGGPPMAPPSRPATSMSNASSIDDLLGAAAPRRPGQKKPRKSGRYVDVMAKN